MWTVSAIKDIVLSLLIFVVCVHMWVCCIGQPCYDLWIIDRRVRGYSLESWSLTLPAITLSVCLLSGSCIEEHHILHRIHCILYLFGSSGEFALRVPKADLCHTKSIWLPVNINYLAYMTSFGVCLLSVTFLHHVLLLPAAGQMKLMIASVIPHNEKCFLLGWKGKSFCWPTVCQKRSQCFFILGLPLPDVFFFVCVKVCFSTVIVFTHSSMVCRDLMIVADPLLPCPDSLNWKLILLYSMFL